jgi:hypothetical protein
MVEQAKGERRILYNWLIMTPIVHAYKVHDDLTPCTDILC